MMSGNEHKKSPANKVSWQQFFFGKNLIDNSKKPNLIRLELKYRTNSGYKYDKSIP